jgi:hypothetical protein
MTRMTPSQEGNPPRSRGTARLRSGSGPRSDPSPGEAPCAQGPERTRPSDSAPESEYRQAGRDSNPGPGEEGPPRRSRRGAQAVGAAAAPQPASESNGPERGRPARAGPTGAWSAVGRLPRAAGRLRSPGAAARAAGARRSGVQLGGRRGGAAAAGLEPVDPAPAVPAGGPTRCAARTASRPRAGRPWRRRPEGAHGPLAEQRGPGPAPLRRRRIGRAGSARCCRRGRRGVDWTELNL